MWYAGMFSRLQSCREPNSNTDKGELAPEQLRATAWKGSPSDCDTLHIQNFVPVLTSKRTNCETCWCLWLVSKHIWQPQRWASRFYQNFRVVQIKPWAACRISQSFTITNAAFRQQTTTNFVRNWHPLLEVTKLAPQRFWDFHEENWKLKTQKQREWCMGVGKCEQIPVQQAQVKI